jgi:hypothetical protein
MEFFVIQDITSNAIGGLISSTIAGFFLLTLRFYIRKQDQALERRELILDIKNKTHRSTPIILLYILGTLQLSWTMAIFGVAAVLGQYFGRPNNDWGYIMLGTFLVMSIVMVPISIRLYHRLHRNQFWIKPFIIIVTFLLTSLEVSFITGDFPTPEAIGALIFLLAFFFISLLPGMYIGQRIAKKTQSEFIMTQLFKRLPTQDKKELIELVDSLPSVSAKSKK